MVLRASLLLWPINQFPFSSSGLIPIQCRHLKSHSSNLQIRQRDPCVAITRADEIILAAFKAGDLSAIFALIRTSLRGRLIHELDQAFAIGQEPDFSATHKAILPIWIGGDTLSVFHYTAPCCFNVIITTSGAATLETRPKVKLVLIHAVNWKVRSNHLKTRHHTSALWIEVFLPWHKWPLKTVTSITLFYFFL